mgnify:CR=1 FL=1
MRLNLEMRKPICWWQMAKLNTIIILPLGGKGDAYFQISYWWSWVET